MFVMNCLLVLLLHFFVFESSSENTQSVDGRGNSWAEYKMKYNLSFDEAEEIRRRNIFDENVAFIRQHNSENTEYTLSVNGLAHLEPDEVYSGLIKTEKIVKVTNDDGVSTLDDFGVKRSVDLREEGFVPPVRNQLKCGSCYIFSSLDAIQTNSAAFGREVPDLSQQAVLDCTFDEGNKGCNGGLPRNVFRYAMKKGIPPASNYSYKARKTVCHDDIFHTKYFISGFKEIESGNEHGLVRTLMNHFSVVLSIDASSKAFRFYKEGIFVFPTCSSYDLNHAVLAVGYVLKGRIPYIIVKNSWGTEWGEDGFIKMPLFRHNQCGIATDSSYPIPAE